MKRVIVIGCPGSGKTTFSEKLSKRTGLLPWIEKEVDPEFEGEISCTKTSLRI